MFRFGFADAFRFNRNVVFFLLFGFHPVEGWSESGMNCKIATFFWNLQMETNLFFVAVGGLFAGFLLELTATLDRVARVRTALQEGRLLWMHAESASDSLDVNQGLYK